MAHHGDTTVGGLPDSIRAALDRPLIGATGTYPEGQVAPGDLGAIQWAIGIRNGRVVLDFGAPLVWLSMNPGDAQHIATAILQAASCASLWSPRP